MDFLPKNQDRRKRGHHCGEKREYPLYRPTDASRRCNIGRLKQKTHHAESECVIPGLVTLQSSSALHKKHRIVQGQLVTYRLRPETLRIHASAEVPATRV